jgi:hypothetical protein
MQRELADEAFSPLSGNAEFRGRPALGSVGVRRGHNTDKFRRLAVRDYEVPFIFWFGFQHFQHHEPLQDELGSPPAILLVDSVRPPGPISSSTAQRQAGHLYRRDSGSEPNFAISRSRNIVVVHCGQGLWSQLVTRGSSPAIGFCSRQIEIGDARQYMGGVTTELESQSSREVD